MEAVWKPLIAIGFRLDAEPLRHSLMWVHRSRRPAAKGSAHKTDRRPGCFASGRRRVADGVVRETAEPTIAFVANQ